MSVPWVGSTAPMPLSIVSEVALLVDQDSVELCPAVMLAGVAVNWMVGGTWTTVNVALALAVPPAPVAVMV